MREPQQIAFEFIPEEESSPAKDARLDIRVDSLGLRVRSQNGLRYAGIVTVGDLVKKTRFEIAMLRHLGKKSVEDIEKVLRLIGLSLSGEPAPTNADLADPWPPLPHWVRWSKTGYFASAVDLVLSTMTTSIPTDEEFREATWLVEAIIDDYPDCAKATTLIHGIQCVSTDGWKQYQAALQDAGYSAEMPKPRVDVFARAPIVVEPPLSEPEPEQEPEVAEPVEAAVIDDSSGVDIMDLIRAARSRTS